jgi:hypothetical protein
MLCRDTSLFGLNIKENLSPLNLFLAIFSVALKPALLLRDDDDDLFTPTYSPLYISNLADLITMGIPFDYAPDRPEHIDTILNGLDRYNPETTTIFQDYVTQQCEEKSYDCYANLALLKL